MSRTFSRSAIVRQAREAPGRAFALGVAACTFAVAAFLFLQLDAWPPHEDEALALFVGRRSLPDLLDTILGHRGGAPLHFLVAWAVAHLGGGLLALRACSVAFAVASVPTCALLARRVAGTWPALVATVTLSASWMFLFYGLYGRMYSLFLLTSAASYLALLRANDSGRARDWAVWAIAVYLTLATHPYGAVVLATQVLFLVIDRRVRAAAPAFACVTIAAIPFWRSDLVLSGRYDVGVSSERRVGGPSFVFSYLWKTVADFATGYDVLLVPVVVVAALGLWGLARTRRPGALLAAIVFATPTLGLLVTRFGTSTSPETRHLVFALPFFAACLAAGLVRLGPAATIAALVVLLPAQVAWGDRRTPQLYRGESQARVAARHAAAAWLARTSRSDDVLLGYDPLYLEAWERGGHVPETVVPRADPALMLDTLAALPKPLGRGVWVFDASDLGNPVRRLTIPVRYPYPRRAFEVRTFGPFLVIRSRAPTETTLGYLARAWDVQLVGKSLHLNDASVNFGTVKRAIRVEAAR